MENDYISRQAVLETVDKFVSLGFALHQPRAFKDYINAIPPADVRPLVRGRWIFKGAGMTGWDECSECGYHNYSCHPFNYCPRCGSYNGGDDAE